MPTARDFKRLEKATGTIENLQATSDEDHRRHIRLKFLAMAPQAISTLYGLLGARDTRVRLAAAQYIVDRILGRPAQEMVLTARGEIRWEVIYGPLPPPPPLVIPPPPPQVEPVDNGLLLGKGEALVPGEVPLPSPTVEEVGVAPGGTAEGREESQDQGVMAEAPPPGRPWRMGGRLGRRNDLPLMPGKAEGPLDGVFRPENGAGDS